MGLDNIILGADDLTDNALLYGAIIVGLSILFALAYAYAIIESRKDHHLPPRVYNYFLEMGRYGVHI